MDSGEIAPSDEDHTAPGEQTPRIAPVAIPSGHVPHDSALSVTSSTSKEDAARIQELEQEVSDLIERTSNASQRFADYENEIRVLQAKLRQEQRKNSATPSPTPAPLPPSAINHRLDQLEGAGASVDKTGLSRWGSFIARKPSASTGSGSPNLNAAASPTAAAQAAAAREKALEAQLASEHNARLAAEQKAKEVSGEIEELSATLFQQANEMVATERRENAHLKECIRDLEARRSNEIEAAMFNNYPAVHGPGPSDEAILRENKQLKERILMLEAREHERRDRLERLEAATKRIERVRAILVPR